MLQNVRRCYFDCTVRGGVDRMRKDVWRRLLRGDGRWARTWPETKRLFTQQAPSRGVSNTICVVFIPFPQYCAVYVESDWLFAVCWPPLQGPQSSEENTFVVVNVRPRASLPLALFDMCTRVP